MFSKQDLFYLAVLVSEVIMIVSLTVVAIGFRFFDNFAVKEAFGVCFLAVLSCLINLGLFYYERYKKNRDEKEEVSDVR